MALPDKSLLDTFAGIIRDKTPPSDAPDMFEGEKAKTLAALAVYRNNVRSSLSRVLGDIFPVVQELVGDDFFKFLAHEYYQAHPPTSRMVVRYGDRLPAFLEGFAPVSNYPYLPDVARLELMYLTAYHAADAELMPPDEILAVAGEDIASLTVTFHPSVQFLASDLPSATICQAHKDGTHEKLSGNLQGAEHALIARSHNHVTIRVLTRGDFIALRAMSLGQMMGEAVEAASEADDTFDPQTFFQLLFALKIIAEVQQAGK